MFYPQARQQAQTHCKAMVKVEFATDHKLNNLRIYIQRSTSGGQFHFYDKKYARIATKSDKSVPATCV